MDTMTTVRRIVQSRSGVWLLCAILALSQGCVRSEPSNPTDTSSAGQQNLPFRPDADQASDSDGNHPVVPPGPKSATGLPFRASSQPRTLPSGTLLTVQLEDSLSAAKVHAGDVFAASVAAPLTVDGDTLIETGTAVTGRVESAQLQLDRPGLVPGSGYFRLTLNAITVEGRQLALQTSSLFARGTLEQSNGNLSNLRQEGVRVPKGRRLTFRLTAPVTLNGPNSMANRQSPTLIPE
jgi:hypothetical protein